MTHTVASLATSSAVSRVMASVFAMLLLLGGGEALLCVTKLWIERSKGNRSRNGVYYDRGQRRLHI